MNHVMKGARTCGCAGTANYAAGMSGTNKQGCGCGCGGCSSCGGVNGQAECTAGTPESTDRKGPAAASCLPPRPRFFSGELVTDFDLGAIVEYHRSQQMLANGVLAGWGVYCGFSITLDADACAVCVGPGIAVDARGRALVRGGATRLSRPPAADVGRPRDPCDPCVAPPPPLSLYLAVVYDDCLDAAKPRYGNACGATTDPGCDFSRIQERTRLVWIHPDTVRDSYWTSGCLADPCGEPDPEPKCPPEQEGETQERPLDQCSPDIGIQGGVGVDGYARALQHAWNLPRNAAQVTKLSEEQHGTVPRSAVGALLDVISGTACRPCTGEALVILAEVTFATDEGGAPRITVVPRRRRVLSNADLTYLVGYLLERVLSTHPAVPVPKAADDPQSSISCGNPCVDASEYTDELAMIVAEPESERELETAKKEVAYIIVKDGKGRLPNMSVDMLVDIAKAVKGRQLKDNESHNLHQRYEAYIGKRAFEASADKVLEICGLSRPTKERAFARTFLVKTFASNGGTHRTLPFAQVKAAARSACQAAGVVLTDPMLDELAKANPGADRASSRSVHEEVEALRASVESLQRQLDEAKTLAKHERVEATADEHSEDSRHAQSRKQRKG